MPGILILRVLKSGELILEMLVFGLILSAVLIISKIRISKMLILKVFVYGVLICTVFVLGVLIALVPSKLRKILAISNLRNRWYSIGLEIWVEIDSIESACGRDICVYSAGIESTCIIGAIKHLKILLQLSQISKVKPFDFNK